jgi:lipopolysaccharide export system protein LptA
MLYNQTLQYILKAFSATIVLVFGLMISDAAGQQKLVDILEADRIVGGTYEGKDVQRLLGNVHLKHKNFEIYADSVYQFANENEMRAYGNIEVDTGEEKIWADSLTYYTDVDFSELRGRVIMEADSTTLFGNSVDYRFSSKVAHFIDRIRLEDMRGTVRADSGYYYRSADSVRIHGNVQLADSLQYLEGDSLFSNRQEKYYELHSRVFGDDQENNSMLKGDYLEADSTGHRLVTGNAWLKNFETDSSATNSSQPDSASAQPDTTHIQARKIRSQEIRTPSDTSAIIHAYEEVRVWSPDFSAIADTAQYTDSTETFELWSNAQSWHKQVQLTGPYIEVILNDGDIDSLKSYPQPFSVQQDSVIDRLNQITGDTLHADFTAGDLNQIYVYKNAKLLRFTKNKQDSSDGAIELSAPSIRIIFDGGEVDSLKAMGSNQGSFLPENEKTAERQLEGFSWNPDLRPQKPAKPMKRRLPPIPKEIFFELPPRYLIHLQKTDPGNPRLPEDIEKLKLMNPIQEDSTAVDSTAQDSTAQDTSAMDQERIDDEP